MADEDDYERTLLQLAEVHVFRIPVRKTAGKLIWQFLLKLKIVRVLIHNTSVYHTTI